MSEPYEADHGFDVPEPPEALLRRLLHAILLPTGADAPLKEAVNQALDRVMTLRLIEADWTARAEARDASHRDFVLVCDDPARAEAEGGLADAPGEQAPSLFIITGAGDAMEAAAVLEAAGFDVRAARPR